MPPYSSGVGMACVDLVSTPNQRSMVGLVDSGDTTIVGGVRNAQGEKNEVFELNLEET